MKRAIAICFFTVFLFTLFSAAIFVILHWNDPGNGCMFPLDRPARTILGGIIGGFCGFLVSLIVGPTIAITDNTVRRYRMKFADQQLHARNNALTLLRASSVPASLQKRELLRAATAGPTTPQELLRSVLPNGAEGEGRNGHGI